MFLSVGFYITVQTALINYCCENASLCFIERNCIAKNVPAFCYPIITALIIPAVWFCRWLARGAVISLRGSPLLTGRGGIYVQGQEIRHQHRDFTSRYEEKCGHEITFCRLARALRFQGRCNTRYTGNVMMSYTMAMILIAPIAVCTRKLSMLRGKGK